MQNRIYDVMHANAARKTSKEHHQLIELKRQPTCCILDSRNEVCFGGDLPQVNLQQGRAAEQHVNMSIYQALQVKSANFYQSGYIQTQALCVQQHYLCQ